MTSRRQDRWDYVLEEPGLPSWPVRGGAAGWRDLDSGPAPGVDSFRQVLRVLLSRDPRTAELQRWAVEVAEGTSNGWASALHVFVDWGRWVAEDPHYELNGEEAALPDRLRERLGLDRQRDRIKDLMLWAEEFDRVVGGGAGRLRDLIGVVAVTRWSRRGRPGLIDGRQCEQLDEMRWSLERQAQDLGVRPASIRQYQNRLRRLRGQLECS